MKHLFMVGTLGLAAFLPGIALAASSNGTLLDRIVAVVEDDVITQQELVMRLDFVRRQLAANGDPTPPREQLEPEVLEGMILERLQLQLAQRNNIEVDELTLNEAMRKLAAQNDLELAEFRRMLLGKGIDYAAFREQVRNELIISRLRQRLVDSKIQISDQEIDDFLADRADIVNQDVEYRLRHILIPIAENASPTEIETVRNKAEDLRARALKGEDFAALAKRESSGQNAQEGGDLGWRAQDQVPTLFVRQVTTMSPSEVSDVIRSPSGFHIVKLEERRGSRPTLIEQARVRHILIEPSTLINDDEARTRLKSLKTRLAGGADFAELARAHSDDTATTAQGGELGWLSSDEAPPAFQEVIDNLAIGEVSEPFRSPLGWHLVQVLERRRQDRSEDAFRNQAHKIIRSRRIEEETERWLRQLRDESFVESPPSGDARGEG